MLTFYNPVCCISLLPTFQWIMNKLPGQLIASQKQNSRDLSPWVWVGPDKPTVENKEKYLFFSRRMSRNPHHTCFLPKWNMKLFSLSNHHFLEMARGHERASDSITTRQLQETVGIQDLVLHFLFRRKWWPDSASSSGAHTYPMVADSWVCLTISHHSKSQAESWSTCLYWLWPQWGLSRSFEMALPSVLLSISLSDSNTTPNSILGPHSYIKAIGDKMRVHLF